MPNKPYIQKIWVLDVKQEMINVSYLQKRLSWRLLENASE